MCASYLLSDLAKGLEKGSLLRSVLNSIWTGFSFFVTTWVLQEHMKFFEVGREWGPRLLGLLFRLDFQRSIIMLFHLFPLTSLNSPQIIFALLKPLNYIVQVDPWSVAGAFLKKLAQPNNLQSLQRFASFHILYYKQVWWEKDRKKIRPSAKCFFAITTKESPHLWNWKYIPFY